MTAERQKRYALDARTATDRFPGIGRYVINLARAMASLLEQEERLILCVQRVTPPDSTSPSSCKCELCSPGSRSGSLRWNPAALVNERTQVVETPVSPFSLRQQWGIPRTLHSLRCDLYHSPYYLMPYRPGAPTLVTIHDLIPLLYPQHFSPVQRLIFAVTIHLAARAARRVIAVSHATARDLQRFLRLPARYISVIPEAADPAFHPQSVEAIAALRARLNLPERYSLYLGSNKPHKNLTRLVEAWKQLHFSPPLSPPHAGGRRIVRGTEGERAGEIPTRPVPLVIAGAWDPRYPESRQRAKALALEEAVHFLGPIAEEDLPTLYSGAVAFVFPSEYEGFGLPVLEAMACGTPVACSSTSSLAEVAGDAALLFDPTDVADIADALTHLLHEPGLRADLRERGLRRAAQFSWERTARDTLAVYRQTVS